ncbi:MAG: hypothetical protein ACSHX8_01900 [Opitutaceae bacterium]
MPEISEICLSLILIGLYLCGILGVYAQLRDKGTALSTSIAISVPITQAVYSVIFQVRFLTGIALFGIIASLCFIAWSLIVIRKQRVCLNHDRRRIWEAGKTWRFITICLSISLTYGAIQVLLLPPTSIDGATYHLPRVWLFIQENTLFLEHFTRYHEVIFPVGADILFYPFLALGTTAGTSIFSFTSYIAIGAGVYSIARLSASARNAVVCTLIMMSLNVIVLQSVSIKNDIIMANVAIASLAITLRLSTQTSYRQLLLLLCLCIFGVSTKTIFPAFGLGLFCVSVWKLKLWQPLTIQRLLIEARKDTKLTLLLIVPLLVCSQIWLFAWNAKHYGGWSGPDSFTHRHQQHDGFKGFTANTIRYAIHSLEIGFITNSITAPALGLPSTSDILNQAYMDNLEPYFEEAGSERGAFEQLTLTQEDYSWFGVLGAVTLFVFTPLAIIRQPKCLLSILPSIFYYLILSGTVSWMIWNGRFMVTFFLGLTPALAITLNHLDSKLLRRSLAAIAVCSLAVVKTTDFNRPILSLGKMYSRAIEISPSSIFEYSFTNGENIWTKVFNGNRPNPGNPQELLNDIPKGAEVALIGFGHKGHFNFYSARPDITWHPLNGSLDYGQVDTKTALEEFIRSEYLYCAIVGPMPEGFPRNLARHCADDYGHLITKITAVEPSK